MNRYWAIVPVLVMIAVPIGRSPTVVVIAVELTAALSSVLGLVIGRLGLVTAGSVIAAIGYTVSVSDPDAGTDLTGAAMFGLAVLFLLDLSAFARRYRGATVSRAVWRMQLGYWLARAAIILGATGAVILVAMALAIIVPGPGRAVAAGAGAILAFAGALYAGIGRPDT